MLASCWVARKIFLSAARASSRARTLDSRPTTNGVIIWGKMTTSRMGIMGSFLVSNFSLGVVTKTPKTSVKPRAASYEQLIWYQVARCSALTTCSLSCLLHHSKRNVTFFNHFARDFEFFYFLLTGQVVHEIKHELFEDHTQTAGANLAHHGLTGDRAQSVLAEFEAYILKFEKALILLDDGIFGPGEDFNQGSFVEVFKHAHHRQTANELGDKSKFDKVFRLNLAYQFEVALAVGYNVLQGLIFFRLETKRLSTSAAANDLV